jgi:hypothetical protein
MEMGMQKNPHWPYELAEALGSVAISFASYEFVFGHLVGFAENLEKEVLYREVLTLPPSEKLKRLRKRAEGKADEVSALYSALCDRFETILEDRNRYIHAFWYRSQTKLGEFVFVDIHGRKDKLSKETHTCTVRDVMVVSTACHVQLQNLQALNSHREMAPFFTYYLPPDALPISNEVPRRVPHDHRRRS